MASELIKYIRARHAPRHELRDRPQAEAIINDEFFRRLLNLKVRFEQPKTKVNWAKEGF